MARIPAERERAGTPWWLWLLGLLVLAGLIWLLLEAFDPSEPLEPAAEGPVEEVEPAGPAEPAAGVITDAATLLAATDAASLVGREVRLENVYVTSVPGDSVFFARPQAPGAQTGNAAARELAIVGRLDEVVPASPDSVEGRYNIERGQVLSIMGTVREVQDAEPAAWGLTDEDTAAIRDGRIYIRAQRLEITERPGAP